VVDDLADHAPRARGRRFDLLGARIRIHARAGVARARDVGDEHRLLGVVAAPEQAVAGLHAILAVVLRDEARVAELLGAGAQQAVERVDLVLADRLDPQVGLDPLEALRERCVAELREGVLFAPHAQDRGWRAKRVAEVVNGRAADAAPL
jgi:hypothetical protein